MLTMRWIAKSKLSKALASTGDARLVSSRRVVVATNANELVERVSKTSRKVAG